MSNSKTLGTWRDPKVWLAAGVLVGTIGPAAYGLLPDAFWGFLKTDGAANWAQALGSILAILSSAAVVWWQVGKQHRLTIEHEDRSKLDAERDRLLAFIAIAQHAHHLIERIWQVSLEGQDAERFFKTQLDAEGLDLAQAALSSYSPVGLSDAAAVIALLGVRREVSVSYDLIYAHRSYTAPAWQTPRPTGLEPMRARLYAALIEIHQRVHVLMQFCDSLRVRIEERNPQ